MEEIEKEYLRFLRERHKIMESTKEMKIEVGDVVLIKGGEKNKGKCSNIGTVEELLKSKNDVIRASMRYWCHTISYQFCICIHSNCTARWKNQQLIQEYKPQETKFRLTAAAIAEMRTRVA